jgi:hypothetical protein
MQGLGTLVVLGIWTINTCQTASCTGDDNHTYAGMPESRVSNDQRAFGNGWLHRGADRSSSLNQLAPDVMDRS